MTQLEARMRHILSTTTTTVRDQLDATLSAYLELSPTEKLADCDGDMLLFQWGTYDWGEGRWFEVDLTRQFLLDEDEDDEPVQLSLTMRFRPSSETEGLLPGNRWCTSTDGFEQAMTHRGPSSVSPGRRISRSDGTAGVGAGAGSEGMISSDPASIEAPHPGTDEGQLCRAS